MMNTISYLQHQNRRLATHPGLAVKALFLHLCVILFSGIIHALKVCLMVSVGTCPGMVTLLTLRKLFNSTWPHG